MMKVNKDKYQAFYVEWLDSTMTSPVWHTVENLHNNTKEVTDTFQTVSHLVNENKLEYIFAASIHFVENDVVSFGQIFTIPKGCITKMTKIKL